MGRPAFYPARSGDCVMWNAAGRPFRMTEREVEHLLDLFSRVGEINLFHELYEANVAAGGLARCSTMTRKAA